MSDLRIKELEDLISQGDKDETKDGWVAYAESIRVLLPLRRELMDRRLGRIKPKPMIDPEYFI